MLKKRLPLFVVLAYVQMLTTNALANILPINGKTTGELSNQYANLFTPQGATFSIWGLIYFLLLCFCISFFFSSKENNRAEIGRLFISNALFNSAWILAWHYEFLMLSMFIMIGLLVNLILINLALANTKGIINRLLLQLPFTVYFGWITIATIANMTALLVGYKWGGFGINEIIWTQLILGVGVIIALFNYFRFRQMAYIGVVLWAYWGIYAKHTHPLGFNAQYPSIINSLVGCFIALILGAVLIASLRYRVSKNRHAD